MHRKRRAGSHPAPAEGLPCRTVPLPSSRTYPFYLLIPAPASAPPGVPQSPQEDAIVRPARASDTLSPDIIMPLVSPEVFAKQTVAAIQDYSVLSWRAISNIFSRPRYLADIFTQMDSIGVGSMPILVL